MAELLLFGWEENGEGEGAVAVAAIVTRDRNDRRDDGGIFFVEY